MADSPDPSGPGSEGSGLTHGQGALLRPGEPDCII